MQGTGADDAESERIPERLGCRGARADSEEQGRRRAVERRGRMAQPPVGSRVPAAGPNEFHDLGNCDGGNTIAPDNYEHVLEALDMGLNYLDTAPAYGRGNSEAGYAKVIAARPRDRFFLNSKVSLWDINRGKIYKDIFDSLP